MTRTAEQLVKEYNQTKKHFDTHTILKVGTRGFYDVFPRNEQNWEGHSRIHFDRKNGIVSQIDGKKLSNESIKAISEAIKTANKGL